MMSCIVDRTSNFPIHVLQHILLFLPVDDAARTSILSKTWWTAWASLPVFTFEFDGNLCPSRKATMEDLQEEGKKLMKFIRDLGIKLGQQKAVIEKFRLDVVLQDPSEFDPYINQCMGMVTRNCVRELDLRIREHNQSTIFYTLPCAALAVKSLVVLKLRNFKLKGLFADNSKFSCLRELSLDCVHLDDEVMSKLIQSSHALEYLSITFCFGFKHLLIPNLPRLRKVMFDPCSGEHQKLKRVIDYFNGERQKLETVKIEAEHLQSLHYRELRRESGIKMAAFKYLKQLKLICAKMSDQLFEDLVSELPLLEDLSLHVYVDLKSVKVSSHVLKKLQVRLLHSLQEAVIDAPNLILYDYSGSRLPTMFKFNASSLQEAFLTLSVRSHVDTSWFLSLRQYLASFEQHNNLTLSIQHSKAISFLPEELQEFSLPQLPVVKHITVKDKLVSSASYETWLDGLFWCCHPEHATVQSLQFPWRNSDFVSFLCEKMPDGGEVPQCCNSGSTKCWRHFVKSIQGVTSTKDEFEMVVTQTCLEFEWEERCHSP